MAAMRTLLEQDVQRCLETGQGATMPALPTQDPKLAGYVAQAERLFPTFRNQVTLESLEHVLVWRRSNSSGGWPRRRCCW
jgi:hypothetical protein